MRRTLQVLGWAYLAVCGIVLIREYVVPPEPRLRAAPVVALGAPSGGSSAAQWFAAAKPYCNAVEVESWHQRSPAPRGTEGAGYAAACFALAGRIDRARAVIDSLDEDERSSASDIVFLIGHPVADAGDDVSAGPMMEMVVAYQPHNYMALYHAGMSAYSLGKPGIARRYLREFVRIYPQRDGWRSNAREILERLGESAPND
jgi:hypothetical protein